MINKYDYLLDKRKIRCMDRTHLEHIIDDAGLNDYEKNLVLHLQANCTKTKTCYDLCISEGKYQIDLHRALCKLHDEL